MDEIDDIETLQSGDGAETLSGTGDTRENWPPEQPVEAAEPAPAEPEPEPQPGGPSGYDAAIPWRGMPSLPSAEPLVAGVLQGARYADAYDPGFPDAADDSDFESGPDLSDLPDPDDEPDLDEDAGISVAAGVLPQSEAEEYLEAEAAFLEQVSAQGAPQSVEAELVLGVKFSQYGPVYFFTAGQVEPKDAAPGKMVLVDTEQGVALAEVVTARRLRLPLPKIRTEEGLEVEIKPIRGLAGAADIAAASDNRILASGARMFCKECIRERGLDMKLVEVEVLHDRSKIIFYFTAPTRIDFRELVKDLVRNYHTRIELRQIGVRHETQMIGALGNCGMTCCCRRYLRKFAPVTIKMAKEQNLFLNPAKLSGMCGRLLCCLAYEQENYDEFHKRSPKIGKKYKTDSGIVKVMRANLFRQSIFVLDEANVESEYQLEEWEALHPQRYDQPAQPVQPGPAGMGDSERRQEQRPERPRRTERDERRPAPVKPVEPGDHVETGESAEETGAAPVGQPEPSNPDEAGPVSAAEVFTGSALADESESGQDDAFPLEDEAGQVPAKPGDKSIFGLPGARYAGSDKQDRQGRQDQPDNSSRGRPPGPRPDNRTDGGGRRNSNHKHGNRHKPSKKGRNPGGGQG